MSATVPWTICRLLSWTADYLKRSGSQSPRLDAEVLLSHARGCQRIELYTAFEDQPSEQVRAAFREMVRRRAEGTPVAYLVGFKEFYSMTFEVNPDVLIPRPETEHLVVAALDYAKSIVHPGTLRVVDVGTGSGAVAIALAKHLPACHMTAVDISQAALQVAQRNAQRHAIGEDRISWVQGDLLTWCCEDLKFDLIVSNPPYVSADEFAQLAGTVRDYEPRLALVAEQGPLELLRELVRQSALHLVPGGQLCFEISPMLAGQVETMTGSASCWGPPELTKDLSGQVRVVLLKRSTEEK